MDLLVLTEEEWEIQELRERLLESLSNLPPNPWWQQPQAPPQVPCMFDGLPPGTYGLVCSCPRCSPWCVSF